LTCEYIDYDLIAIGRPNEGLPTPGATRIYTTEEWKDVVKHKMQAASLVVIRAGSGENVIWELTQALNLINPQRLLILFLHMGEDDYESFRTRTNSVLPVPLPAPTLLWRLTRPSGFIGFANNWKPRFLALGGPQYSFKGRLKCALKPVFQSFGLDWQAPRVSAARVTAALFGLAIVPLTLFGLWRGPPFNIDVFHDRRAQDEFVKEFADGCKSVNTEPVRRDHVVRWCDCSAREVAKVINVQEFEALGKDQYLESLREKLKQFKC